MKKVTLLTGTSSGIGLETALILAKNGYVVYASMRNLDKKHDILEAAAEAHVEIKVVQLDVTDQDSVDQTVAQIIENEGRIDILINNAGAGLAKTTENVTEAEMQWVMDVNYFGVVRCTKAVIPYMRKQKSGHIVNLSSIGGLVGQPFNEFYCAAKFALEGYTESLATYLTDAFGIKFSLIEPGGVKTNFSKSATEISTIQAPIAPPDYQPILEKYMAGLRKRAAAGNVHQTPVQIAEIILELLQMRNPPLRKRTSEWAENFTRLKTLGDPDGTKLNLEIKERLLS